MESIDLEKDVLSEMIALYKSYKMLWDTSDSSYFNKDARNQAFASLVDVYKRLKPAATVKDVKKKLENMRNTYKKELKKVSVLTFVITNRLKPSVIISNTGPHAIFKNFFPFHFPIFLKFVIFKSHFFIVCGRILKIVTYSCSACLPGQFEYPHGYL